LQDRSSEDYLQPGFIWPLNKRVNPYLETF
jgi:hypothetical protein